MRLNPFPSVVSLAAWKTSGSRVNQTFIFSQVDPDLTHSAPQIPHLLSKHLPLKRLIIIHDISRALRYVNIPKLNGLV